MKKVRIEVYGRQSVEHDWHYRHAFIVREVILQSKNFDGGIFAALLMMDIDGATVLKEIVKTKKYTLSPATPDTVVSVISNTDEKMEDIAAVEITTDKVVVYKRLGDVTNCSSLKDILVLNRAPTILESGA